MTVRLADLLPAVRKTAAIDEWIVSEVSHKRFSRQLGHRRVQSQFEDRRLTARVFADTEGGRGTASVEVGDAERGHLKQHLAIAVVRASAAIGPSWTLPPSAAPARVDVADPALVANPSEVLDVVERRLLRAISSGVRLVDASISATISTHRVVTSRGFDSQYQSSWLEMKCSLEVGKSGQFETVAIGARRPSDLGPEAAIGAAIVVGNQRSSAQAMETGPFDLLVSSRLLMAHGTGIFFPLIAQSDAHLQRQGLSRYRPGQSVFDTGTPVPLTITSDGTLPFGLRSAPFGDWGEPVRRFALIENGIAGESAYDLREAALAGRTANGGIRNLVVSPGSYSADQLRAPGQRPLLEAIDIQWIHADSRSGEMTMGLGLAVELMAKGTSSEPKGHRGGVVLGNAFSLLATARRSQETGNAPGYQGPASMRFDNVTVVG